MQVNKKPHLAALLFCCRFQMPRWKDIYEISCADFQSLLEQFFLSQGEKNLVVGMARLVKKMWQQFILHLPIGSWCIWTHTHIQCAMCEQHCKELGVQIPGCVSSTKQQSIDHRIIAGQHERYCTMETLSNARERQQQLQSKAIYNNVPALRAALTLLWSRLLL